MQTPSTDQNSASSSSCSRRRLLAALGTGTTAAFAGCGSVLTGDARSLNPPAVTEDVATERVWEFPRGASDANTTVEVALDQTARVPTAAETATVRFTFTATVFGHSGYHHDRIRLRLRADRGAATPPASIFVEPLAGGFTSFRTYVRDRETVVELDDLEEDGTLQFDFLVDPGTGPVPETLHYDFEVTAAEGGLLGSEAVASDAGQFPIARTDG